MTFDILRSCFKERKFEAISSKLEWQGLLLQSVDYFSTIMFAEK
jgi:hypothetical protein